LVEGRTRILEVFHLFLTKKYQHYGLKNKGECRKHFVTCWRAPLWCSVTKRAEKCGFALEGLSVWNTALMKDIVVLL
jgi:hypothetical protein